jgi:hypothetical protein
MRQLTGRQGDVYFVADKIPVTAKRVPLRPFALGEVTGHSHRVCVADEAGVEMFEVEDDAGKTVWMRVTKDGAVSLVHEDHDPSGTVSVLPSGWEGEVVIAREYQPEGIRSVVD